MSDFAIGDLVKLKCGSPQMTVNNFERDPSARQYVETVWFEGKVLHRDIFDPAALKIAPPRPNDDE